MLKERIINGALAEVFKRAPLAMAVAVSKPSANDPVIEPVVEAAPADADAPDATDTPT